LSSQSQERNEVHAQCGRTGDPKARYKCDIGIERKVKEDISRRIGLRGIYRLRLEFERWDAIICLILFV